jgi:hypothetical protein
MREATRFSKGLMPWTGYRSVEIPYSRVARAGGQTSWNSIKLWRYALDGIFSFSVTTPKSVGSDRCADFSFELYLCRPDCVAHRWCWVPTCRAMPH